MTKIKIKLPEKLQKFEYVNILFFTAKEFEEKFEKYLDILLVQIELQLPPHDSKQTGSSVEQIDGNYILYIRFQLHWKDKTNLTSLPTPQDVSSLLSNALERLLNDFKKSDNNLE